MASPALPRKASKREADLSEEPMTAYATVQLLWRHELRKILISCVSAARSTRSQHNDFGHESRKINAQSHASEYASLSAAVIWKPCGSEYLASCQDGNVILRHSRIIIGGEVDDLNLKHWDP